MKRLSAETTGRGFTIIEVLVAVGLTSLLMAAMYSAMNIYWTSATDSYEEIERGQIARAILREMARDIQSATFVEQDTSESDDDGDSDEAVDADTAMASYTNGLFGSSSDLVLYISRPDRTNSYVAAQEVTSPADRSSDAMIVRY
ncbi:MAG: prepilin-type N-terminal cleavage/methylation domain-containing protein, partial [Fuerstiella sp.]